MATKLNTDGLALREVIAAELERQHEQSGIHDLVVRRTEEPSQLSIEGKVDLDELSLAIMRHGIGTAYKALVGYDPFEDDPSQTLEEVTELFAGVLAEHKAAEEQTARDKLEQAEWLIREMSAHEGAEGFSNYLTERLDGYVFVTKPAEGQSDGKS